MEGEFPHLKNRLPELVGFIEALARGDQSGALEDEEKLNQAVKAFFTTEMMAGMETIAPGWGKMAGYANGATQTHVISVYLALHLAPERHQLTPTQQELVHWMILFHDIGKEIQPGRRDNLHAFRSAAMTAQALPALGFKPLPGYPARIQGWVDLVENAVTIDPTSEMAIQDNRKLPVILEGLAALFGKNAPAYLVVKAVLLHLSVVTVLDWPPPAPLSDDELKEYIDPYFLPLLETMMQVDSDAWALFDEELRESQKREVCSAFRHIEEIACTS